MIDPELVIRKASLILQDMPALKALSQKNLNDYLSDPINEVLAERYLERIIGRIIDISYHLITEQGQAPPRDYHESFLNLVPLGVLPAEFACEIAYCAGLRNRIVHDYDDIDAVKVYGALSVAVQQFPVYLEHIHRFVRTLPKT